ncbi:membrane protein [Nitrospira sp. KM1]|uniref:OmpA family protein n=1 Tax=Nitrospira sp. KM1 TaxID=1936990 RepID=UPI0013A7B63D|nr:OmpA family protein [Nitrospira sp. KM1]BCA56990.1 membrane protein [Nitrospira sp. KM1]
MNRMSPQDSQAPSDTFTSGITDLMTSLAVIFILLLTAYVTREETSATKTDERVPSISTRLEEQMEPHHLNVESEPANPNILSVVIPDAILNFEFGKSTLMPAAHRFLSETMPNYAAMMCSGEAAGVESFVIEGHTDDLGDDLRNLKLSQDRSFAVMAKGLEVIRETMPWAYECFQEKTSANGRGKQDLLRYRDGTVDRDSSRRVVFRFHLRHV